MAKDAEDKITSQEDQLKMMATRSTIRKRRAATLSRSETTTSVTDQATAETSGLDNISSDQKTSNSKPVKSKRRRLGTGLQRWRIRGMVCWKDLWRAMR